MATTTYISIGRLSIADGTEYNCSLFYDDATRSGDNVTLKNIGVNITPIGQDTAYRIAVMLYISGSSTPLVDNATIKPINAGGSVTTLLINSYTLSCLYDSIPLSVTIASTGPGSSWSTGYGSVNRTGAFYVPPRTYTVSYNANNGSGAPATQTKYYQQTLTLSSTVPTRTGYTFQGWNTAANGSGTPYASGGTYAGNADVTLYAQWALETYTVSYNANGGSGMPENQTKTYGVTLVLSGITSGMCERTGYDFIGWSTTKNGSVAYQPGDDYTENAAVTLYAVWSIKTYTVKYNANGGSGAPSQQTKTYGAALTLRTGVPTRTGYNFLGWATTSSGSVAYQPGDSYTTNSGVTLYAKWQIITYTVSYNKNTTDTVTNLPSSQTKEYGNTLTLSNKTPERTGYTFQGWATSASGAVAYQPNGSYTSNSGVTLYAKWQIITYTISYNANGGSGAPADQSKDHGTAVVLSSTVPTYTGYDFLGWATSASGAVAYQPGNSYIDNSNVTLFAKWQEKTYTVSYNKNSATAGSAPSSQTKYHFSNLTLQAKPSALARTGYTFQGWNTNASGTGTHYNASATYSTNAAVTLYAEWQINTYTVSYNANGGSGAPSNQTKTYGVTLSLSSTIPTRTGYTFNGWNTAADGSGTAYASGSTYSDNAGTTLYAQWTMKKATLTSVADKTLGTKASVKWTPWLTSQKFKIKFSIGSWEYTYGGTNGFISPNQTTEYTSTGYTIPIVDSGNATGPAFQITAAKTGTMTATLYTYDSSENLIGTDSKMFTVTVPDSCKPTLSSVSISPTGSNSAVNAMGIYVAGYSKIACAATGNALYGAKITSVSVSGAASSTTTGNATSLSLSYTSGVMTSGEKTLTFVATDSRGYSSASTVKTATVMSYAPPEITQFQAVRQTADATVVNALATWTYDSLNGNNTITSTSLQYKRTSVSTWSTSVSTLTSGTASALGDVYNVTYSYDLKLSVTDTVGNTTSRSVIIPTISVWEHMPVDGAGVAFGKILENTDHFESGWPVKVYGDVKTTGNYLGAGSVEFIKGTQAASTNAWTGVTKDAALYDGKMIMYVLPYAGTSSGATLNLTLAGGSTTGAKGVYRYGGTTQITTHFSAGSRMLLIYDADNSRWNINNYYNTNTTYESKEAASGGTAVSLVTTGEKYIWNSKAAGDHTHTLSLATSTGTSALDLSANSKYQLTAGGNTYIFKTPTDTTYESKTAASGGTAVSLVTTGEKYTWNNKSDLAIGTTATTAAAGNHTHTLSLATSTGTSALDLSANSKYQLTAGGKTYIFKTPADTTYESKTAASGGTAVSLVTTGEKYTWNNKSNLAIGTTATTAAAGNHTHTLSLATSTGTSALDLSANSKYQLTAGGNTYIFKTPADTTYESKSASSGGTAVSLVTTGEKYTWNNKSDLAIGTTATTAAAGNHTHTTTLATSTGTSSLTLAAGSKYSLTAGGTSYIFTMPSHPSNAARGHGYGTCSTAASTAEKAVTLSGYTLVTGGYVTVKFTNDVPGSAKLNINSKGAKDIYFMGGALPTNTIMAGDFATFVYDGTRYHLINIAQKGIREDTDYIKLPGGTIIQMGAEQVTFTTAQYVDVTVTFENTMPSTSYRVFTMPSSMADATQALVPVVELRSKTTAKFTMRVWKNLNSTATTSAWIGWMAIGN